MDYFLFLRILDHILAQIDKNTKRFNVYHYLCNVEVLCRKKDHFFSLIGQLYGFKIACQKKMSKHKNGINFNKNISFDFNVQ